MVRYMIFGAGLSGRAALNLIGFERTDFFIDNNKGGTEYCGKDVITYMDMLKKNSEKYVIVVASQKYHREIAEQLSADGVKNYFVYQDDDIWGLRNIYPRYYLCRQAELVTYTRILWNNNIRNYKKICIYGDNVFLHYLICDTATQSSITSIYGIVETKHDSKYSLGIPSVQLEDAWNEIDCLILNVRRNESEIFDYLEKAEHKFNVISMYDVDSYEPSFYNASLQKYKDIHKGKRIWLIGNGPSLNVGDLETLYENKEICFGFNKIYKIYEQTRWRADYIGITDRNVIESCSNIRENLNDTIIFVGDEFHRSTDVKIEGAEYVHINHEEYYPQYPNFSDDIANQIYWGCTVSYDIGIQMAYYMGASEVYLIGMDNSSVGSITDKRNHFIKDYFTETEEKVYEGIVTEWHKINKSYEKAERFSREHGFRIYNATRGGMLESFERVELNSLFNKQ